ncbi:MULTISPECIES: M48 family metalloprotease [Sphingomonadales]|nr:MULTISPECIES: M48 family metalloprotease [Sphingomonadales]ALG62193.1 peptidase M48 [Citromicrobium sp. JL477]OAM06920.1 peptidase M48 [Citromicrobium sp. RCC1897]KPM16707.1 peptidase M48 [Citromicrobium sp. JL31]KPM19154.1 peptidase M48 [Citromicrobium sp. JL1351]KPM21818.1 peptidase M48 [Citromicrobium sp. RCC1885]
MPALALRRVVARFVALLLAFSLTAQPAMAQSILRDAETEALLRDLADPLVEAAGLRPGNVDVVLVNDPSINAFVAGGQVVYLHSGLINAADSANEVQGVIAHELGHITGGHVINTDGASAAQTISILSLLIGVAMAAAGGGDAAMGAIMAGQRAAMGKYLAFNRTQESSADAAGAQFLSDAGITGKGSLEFFGKLLNQEYRYSRSQSEEAGFNRTHPLSGDRIARLREVYEKDPAWNTPPDPQLQARFERVRAKLYGYLAEPARTLKAYPVTRTDIPARYARAYAYHKDARIDQALAETDALIASDPDNPYFLELRGQVLLESGRPDEALPALRRATELTQNEPLIASLFGHALIATEDRSHYDEAESVLRAAVAKDRRNPFAWYQLGMVYAAKGDMPRAHLASAEQQVMQRQYIEALRSAQLAESALPEGSADWLRAQDVRMQAQAALEAAREDS